MTESSRAKRRTTDLKNNRRGNLRATNGNLEVTYRVTGTTTTQTTTQTYTYTYETTTTQTQTTNTNYHTLQQTYSQQFTLSDGNSQRVYSGSTTQQGERQKIKLQEVTGTFYPNNTVQTELTNEKFKLQEKKGNVAVGTTLLIEASEQPAGPGFDVTTPKTRIPYGLDYLYSNTLRRISASITGFNGSPSTVKINTLKFATYRTTTTTTTETVTNTITNTFTNTNTNTNTFSTTKTTTKSATLI